jgi:hypothetical protein
MARGAEEVAKFRAAGEGPAALSVPEADPPRAGRKTRSGLKTQQIIPIEGLVRDDERT